MNPRELLPPTRVIAAPMAGGPSTPELVAATTAAGGLGFLAGGYLSAAALGELIAATRGLGVGAFGVNLFVPARGEDGRHIAATVEDLAAVARYRDLLARESGLDLPEARAEDDDHYPAKVDALAAEGVPLVSFTFGLPTPEESARLRAAGSVLMATVTSLADARTALTPDPSSGVAPVDALWVQGFEAGGHRSTFTIAEEPNETPARALVADIRAALGAGVVIVASGGIADAAGSRDMVAAGADAVAAGTAFLATVEAGTSATHRAALGDDSFAETALTRVFTGRPARGLRNAFIDAHEGHAPPVYPQLHHVTGALRKAAAAEGRARDLHLWAGTRWRDSRGISTAAEAVARLNPGAP